MKKKLFTRVWDSLFGCRDLEKKADSFDEEIDLLGVLGEFGSEIRSALGERVYGQVDSKQYRGIDYYIQELCKADYSRCFKSTITGIVLPTYNNLSVNQCVCDDVFSNMLRSLKLSKKETSPCFFEMVDGNFVPALYSAKKMAVDSKSKAVISCYLDNKEVLDVAFSEIRRLYPTSKEERERVVGEHLEDLFIYSKRRF